MNKEQNCCGQTQEQEVQIVTNEMQEVEWYTDKEQNADDRYKICQECEQLVPLVSMCKQCGCFMKIKTRIYSSSCPLGKW